MYDTATEFEKEEDEVIIKHNIIPQETIIKDNEDKTIIYNKFNKYGNKPETVISTIDIPEIISTNDEEYVKIKLHKIRRADTDNTVLSQELIKDPVYIPMRYNIISYTHMYIKRIAVSVMNRLKNFILS